VAAAAEEAMLDLILSAPAAVLAWALVVALLVAWIRQRLAASEAKGDAGSERVEAERHRARAERAEHDAKALTAQVAALEEHVRRERAAGDVARAEAVTLRDRLAKAAQPGAVLDALRAKLGGP
jgi:biopolymer transport protein ExbB/TolQ